MAGERSADEPHTCRSGAVVFKTFDSGRDHFGVVSQAEVIVRAEDENFSVPADLHHRSHRRLNFVKRFELAGFCEVANQGVSTIVEICVRHGESKSVRETMKGNLPCCGRN